MKSLRSWVKTQCGDAHRANLGDLGRHPPGARTLAGPAVHLLAPGKGQSWAEVQPDAAAQGPAHWPSSRPSPSSAASRENPEGIL